MSPTTLPGLDRETLDMTLDALSNFAADRLPDEKLLELDRTDEFPEEIVRALGSELGIQLLFIPESFNGLGGGAFDVYRVCEAMGRIDLGIATGVLATFLGSEPIAVGGLPEQQQRWLGRIADEGILFAYGATEPEAGSDLAALRTVATRVEQDGELLGYRITGAKQWISNGGVADCYTILANTPGGPSWFVVDRDTAGFTHGKPEEKHGIRASNTAALSLEEVFVEPDRLIGGVEGQGLAQAQSVFGYTRLMVAAFGLGAGWAALDRAIPYSESRIQAGTPLSQKQGYTHKLIVPHIIRLEAARAFIEDVAEKIDAGAGILNTEGAIAKYLATEFGNAAADAAIQALGGYGYTHEYMVEKIKRDVRITTIYEGTSEIMEMTVSRDRWQAHLKTRGRHYHDEAERLEALHASNPSVGADIAAHAAHALAEILERARVARLTRHQHVQFRLGELISKTEAAAVFARRAAALADGTLNPKADRRFKPDALAAASRAFARETAHAVALDGLRWVLGAGGVPPNELAAFQNAVRLNAILAAQDGLLADYERVAEAVYQRHLPTEVPG